MLYMVLVVAQLLIERQMKLDILLEVPFSFIMGYILDLYQIIIPASPESLGLRIVILLAGNVCTAFGVLYNGAVSFSFSTSRWSDLKYF